MRDGVRVRLLLGVGVLLFVIVRVTEGDFVTDLLLLGVGVVLRVIVLLTEGDAVSDRVIVGVAVTERVFVGVPDGLATIVRVIDGERVTLRVADGERLIDLLLVGVRELEKRDGNFIRILGNAVVGSSVGSFGIDGSSVSGSLIITEGSSVIRRSGMDGSSVFGNAVFGTSIGGRLGYSVAGISIEGIGRSDGRSYVGSTGTDGMAGRLVIIVGIS